MERRAGVGDPPGSLGDGAAPPRARAQPRNPAPRTATRGPSRSQQAWGTRVPGAEPGAWNRCPRGRGLARKRGRSLELMARRRAQSRSLAGVARPALG